MGQFLVTYGGSSSIITMTSRNGTGWTAHTGALLDSGYTCAFGAGLFVVGTNLGTTTEQIMTSRNGINWTARSSPADGQAVIKVIYGGGQFVAIWKGSGATNYHGMTSPDGITWTTHTLPTGVWLDLAYSSDLGIYIMVGNNGAFVLQSGDGAGWSTITTPEGNDWEAVEWGAGLFVVLGGPVGSGDHLMTSPDGNTWTVQTNPSSQSWLDVVFAAGQFVAVTTNGTGRAMTSADGINWTIQSTTNRNWTAIAYGNGLYVACADDNADSTHAVMTSPNGTAWTVQTTVAAAFAHGICFGGSNVGNYLDGPGQGGNQAW